MNQRIAVRAMIHQENKILLLKRATGRESILGMYELPGGRLTYGEQPEDALRRYLHDDVGLHIEESQLFDVVSYIDRDDRNIQYAVITYTVTLAPSHHDLRLSENYDEYSWYSASDTQQYTLTDLTYLLLGILQQSKLTDKTNSKLDIYDETNTTNSDAIIYTDGGSRGNPGPSACGFVVMNTNQNILTRGGEYLGITTNNQAEYHGVRLGLETALGMGLKRIEFKIDSMLVVNQMNGLYTIKNRELWPINERIRNLMLHFDKVSFHHVPRELNQLADTEVNRVLNEHASLQHEAGV